MIVRRWSRRCDDAAIVQLWASKRSAPSNHYRFVTWWRLRASAAEIWDAVIDPVQLVRWFPATFLDVWAAPGSGLRPGSRMRFLVKGWLPYTLRFDGCVDRLEDLRACSVTVAGDFEGRLSCEFRERGEHCTVRFEWDVAVQKPLVRRCSMLLKPLFASNHLWVMLRGWQSLRIELANRRANRLEIAGGRAVPPGPTFPYGGRAESLRRALLPLYRAVRSELNMSR